MVELRKCALQTPCGEVRSFGRQSEGGQGAERCRSCENTPNVCWLVRGRDQAKSTHDIVGIVEYFHPFIYIYIYLYIPYIYIYIDILGILMDYLDSWNFPIIQAVQWNKMWGFEHCSTGQTEMPFNQLMVLCVFVCPFHIILLAIDWRF